jgi:periplasmic protein CpxP/Spy
MKKILWSVLTVVVLAGGLVTLTAFRARDPSDPGRLDRFVSHRLDDLLDDVRATAAQRQQLNALKDKLLADGHALHAGQADAKKQLLAEWRSEAPDKAKVMAIVDERADAMKKMAEEVAAALVDAHGILNESQRALVTRKLERHLGE